MGNVLKDPDNEKALRDTGDLVCAALDKEGMLVLSNLGLSKELLGNMDKVTSEFFSLPLNEKMKVAQREDFPYGYENTEGLYLSEDGIQDTQSGAIDEKETYNAMIGREGARESFVLWPESPARLQSIWTEYYRSIERVADCLMRVFAVSLSKEQNFFEKFTREHQTTLRALFYPDKTPLSEGIVRCGAHSDWGPLTLLRQAAHEENMSGLQVLYDHEKGDSWIDVSSGPDELVVNVGDMMTYWTNGRWKAVKHRVVQKRATHTSDEAKSTGRMSFAFFFSLSRDAVVDPRDIVGNADGVEKRPPVNAHEYLMQKYHASKGKTGFVKE